MTKAKGRSFKSRDETPVQKQRRQARNKRKSQRRQRRKNR